MHKDMYIKIENHMHSCMNDGAHDHLHIYRVLYSALDIAKDYEIDTDVLIAAALLHDIGRDAQFQNPDLDHALIGANMAYKFLLTIGWPEDKACQVKSCISTHRYRNNNPPVSMEAKILYDADKLDVTGTIGIARTLAYKGIVADPLYSINENGNVLSDKEDDQSSFFQEYNLKLKNVYDKFFTVRAKAIAEERRQASVDFYESMFNEVKSVHKAGLEMLSKVLE